MPVHEPLSIARSLSPPLRRFALAVALALAIVAPITRVSAQAVVPEDSAARAFLLRAIRTGNPELIARRAAVDAAEARARAAGFLPAASLAIDAEEIPSGLDLGQAGSIRVGVERALFAGGRRSAARAVAATDVASGRSGYQAVERRLLALADQRVASAAGWIAIARRLGAEDSLLASAEASLRAHFTAGDARYVDVLRLRTERLRVQTEAARALTEARISRRLLDALAGVGESGDSVSRVVAGRLDSLVAERSAEPFIAALPEPPDVDSLVAIAGALRLADAKVAGAEARRRLVLAEQRPRVVASLGAQRFGQEDGSHTYGPTFGVTVSLPFTAGRANAAAAHAAAQGVAAASAERTATRAAVVTATAAAAERYEAALERLAVYDAALLKGAEEEREGALASFRSGALSLLELLDFERALAGAQVDRVRARIEAADALADLLTGAVDVVPHSSDLISISSSMTEEP